MLKLFSRVVDSNEREIRRLEPLLERANALEPEYRALTDDDLRGRTALFRERLREDLGDLVLPAEDRPAADEEGGSELVSGDPARRREHRLEQRKREMDQINAALEKLLPEAFAAVREAMQRALAKRHYDVQLIGGMVLHRGHIAEMKTGEGKTFVAPLAAYLNALAGQGVHVVTVNDYLAKRDAQWIGAVFHRLGMQVGSIQHEAAFVFDPDFVATDERLRELRPVTRREAYAADVTYGTNNEFGFDFLRDNLVTDLTLRVQRGHFFGIVDEVDNILIDEARTPLIISGQGEQSTDRYTQFARLVPRLKFEEDYIVDEKFRQVAITEAGTDKMERMLGVANLFDDDFGMARHLEQALKAEALYKRDRDYVVKDGEVVIVDEFTGRLMPGRRWSEGLHQAVEAKEGVRIQSESMTLATITFQNYFRMYRKLAGMTGTAETEAEEFHKIYGLEVVVIPTHVPMIRDDFADLVYAGQQAKWEAVAQEVAEEHEKGRPVLVGTISVEVSEMLSDLLKRRGIKHNVLNAKFHEREAEIVAQAGRSEAVTIATNMAGRGTDILLGGNPDMLAADLLHQQGTNVLEATPEQVAAAQAEAEVICAADRERVVALGGLHIVGTERHEARRIDNQLRGRSGRQGDPGSSRFYLSLEDDLMRRFASDRVQGLMKTVGFTDDMALESGIVSRTIEGAQTRVEGYNFDLRKHVVQYDDVINLQRETIYGERDHVLRAEDLSGTVLELVDAEVRATVAEFTAVDPSEWNREGLKAQLTGMIPNLTAGELAVIDEGRDADAVADALVEAAEASYQRRQAELGDMAMAGLNRIVLLRVIDSLWVEHLTAVDDMRQKHRPAGLQPARPPERVQGRGLPDVRRAEGDDPPRRGADDLPGDGRAPARRSGADSDGGEPAGPVGVGSGRRCRGDGAPPAAAAAASRGGNGQPARAATKIGRNDPCYCGSGKKYKRCHGA